MQSAELWERQQKRLAEEHAAYVDLLDRTLIAEHEGRMAQLTERQQHEPADLGPAFVWPPPVSEEKPAGALHGSFRKGEWEISKGRYHLIAFSTPAIGLGVDFSWGAWPCWMFSLELPLVSIAFGRHDWPAE